MSEIKDFQKYHDFIKSYKGLEFVSITDYSSTFILLLVKRDGTYLRIPELQKHLEKMNMSLYGIYTDTFYNNKKDMDVYKIDIQIMEKSN